MTSGAQISRIYDRLNGSKLQPWYKVEIVEKAQEGRKDVIFHSRIHVKRANSPSFCFSNKISDDKILKDHDLINWIVNRYGVVVMGTCTCE